MRPRDGIGDAGPRHVLGWLSLLTCMGTVCVCVCVCVCVVPRGLHGWALSAESWERRCAYRARMMLAQVHAGPGSVVRRLD